MRPAVFFDRDDTLLRRAGGLPTGDLGDPGEAELTPGALEACELLKSEGFALVVVTNQGGVARGSYGIADVERVHAWLNERLGGAIEAFRACPYHPLGSVAAYRREHPWRKPAPGMILDAAASLGLDLARSWMVGDSTRDCEAGLAAGCRTVLLDAGADGASGAFEGGADFIAPGVLEAARVIVRESAGRRGVGS